MTSSLGSVVLELSVNLARWTSEMMQAARISDTRLREIERHASRAASRMQNLGNTMRNAFVAIGIGAAIRSVVQHTAQAEAANAKLAAVLRATGNASGFTAEQLQKMAKDLQKVTTYGDEMTIDMMGMLASFKAIRGDVFKEAVEAIMDLSTTMGQDLRSSVIQVGKALNDPITGLTALRRVGVAFTAEQEKMVKAMVRSGDLMGAQKLILKELQAEFGGTARAARDVFSGALAGVKNAWADLLELKSGLEGSTRALNNLAKLLEDPGIQTGFDSLFSGAVLFGTKAAEKIAEVAAGVKVLAEELAAWKFGPAIDDTVRIDDAIAKVKHALANQLPKIGGRLVIFGPDGIVRYWSEEELQRELARLQAMLRQSLPAAAKMEEIVVTAPRLTPGDPDAIAKQLEAQRKTLADYHKGIVDDALKAAEQMRTPTQKIVDEVNDALLSLRQLAREHPDMGPWVAEQIELWNRWGDAQLQAAEKATAVGRIRERMINEARALTAALATPQETLANNVRHLNGLFESLKGTINEIDPETWARGMIKYTEEFNASIQESTSDWTVFAEQAARNMQDAFANFLFDPMKEGFRGLLSGFVDVIRRMVAELAASQLIKMLGGAFSSSGNVFLSSIGTFLTGKAAGGPVYAGNPYLVGEKGPELFVPRASGTIVPNGAMGGGNVSISYTIDARGADADRIMAILPGMLRQTEQRTVAQVRDLISRGRLV